MKRFILLIVLFLITKASFGQQSIMTFSEAKPGNAFTVVDEPSIYKYRVSLGKTAQANFLIEYEDEGEWTLEQKDALEKAVDIWSHLLKDNTQIVISVKWSDSLGTTALGDTRTYLRNNFANAPKTNFHYSKAFAKQKDASLNDGSKDMRIRFNKTFRDENKFSFDLDGIPIKDKYDFITVALHEMTHGLGFASSMAKSGSNGDFGVQNIPINTNEKYAYAYDEFLKHGNDYLINIAHPSYTLGQYLTSNNVFYNGTKTKKVNNNSAPKIHAPSTWKPGTSISHLDETAFPEGDPNSLLSASLSASEVIRNPGYIVLGVLEDIGWSVERLITAISPSPAEEIMRGSTYTIKWHDNIDVQDQIKIELYQNNGQSDVWVANISLSETSYPGTINNGIAWTFPSNYEYGWYFLRFLSSSGVEIGQSGLFQILEIPAAPTFDPPGGTYPETQYVSLNTSTEGAVIKYSTENNDPTQDYTFGSTIPVTSTMKIRAKSVYTFPNNDTRESPVVEAIYYIDTYSDAVTVDVEGTGISVSSTGYQSNQIELDPTHRSYLSFTINGANFPDNIDLQSVSISILFFSNYYEKSFYIVDFNKPSLPVSSVPGDYYNNIGAGTPYETVTISGNYFQIDHSNFLNEIKDILDNNLYKTIYLGLKNTDEVNSVNRIYHKLNDPDKAVLKITYVPKYNFLLDQRDSDNESFGQAEYWENSSWQTTPFVPYKDTKDFGTQVTLKADQDFKENTTELMNLWTVNQIQTSIINYDSFTFNESGSNIYTASFKPTTTNIVIRNLIEGIENINDTDNKIYFKDPWLLDQTNPTYGNYNSGMSASHKPISSPFRVYENATYRGIFKEQFTDQDFYYSLKFPETIPLSVGNVSFVNWESTGTDELDAPQLSGGFYETPVVFTADQAVVTANYKGTNLTGDGYTYSYNNQRRIVKAYDGSLHKVYESMGKVWYETSTDDGSTWTIMNNGQPLYSGNAKSPAITVDATSGFNEVIIVFQKEAASGCPELVINYYINNSHTPRYTYTVLPVSNIPYSYNLTPSIALRNSSEIMLIYDVPHIPVYVEEPGIYYWYGSVGLKYGTGIEDYSSGIIPNTGANSSYPSIVAENYSTAYGTFHVAWQESTSIKYIKLVGDYNAETVAFSDYYDVSSSLGYSASCPTIAEDNNPSYPTRFYVAWQIEHPVTYLKDGAMRINTNGNWHVITYTYTLGGANEVETINLNENNSFGAIIAMGSSQTNGKYVKTSSPTSTYTLPYTGDVKMSNGSTYSDQRISVLQKASTPYSFVLHGQGGLQKSNDNITLTNEISLKQEDRNIYLGFGEIEVDGKFVKFETVEDTATISSKDALKSHFVSEPFILTDNSKFSFVLHQYTNENKGKILSDENSLEYKIILVDDQTNEVIGEYVDDRYDSKKEFNTKTEKYNVDTKGVGNRSVRLEMTVEGISGSDYHLITKVGDSGEELPKENEIDVEYEGSLAIKDYALMNNYPNPFNPSTRIRYQIPKDGFVTLKVYDILGKEIATLVEEAKSKGKYDVVFDSSNLSSGVYIYTIDVHAVERKNFKTSKKMLLVK